MVKIVLRRTPLSLGQGAALPCWYQDRGWQRCRHTVHGTWHSTCSCCRNKGLPACKPHCTLAWSRPKSRFLQGENIIESAVQNDFLLKGTVTMNNEFSASLWQFFCLLRSILFSNLVVPRPPSKSVRITNVFVDRNTADDICYATQSAQAEERSQKLTGPHSAPTTCLLTFLPGVLR